jgi:hypothetical protein
LPVIADGRLEIAVPSLAMAMERGTAAPECLD